MTATMVKRDANINLYSLREDGDFVTTIHNGYTFLTVNECGMNRINIADSRTERFSGMFRVATTNQIDSRNKTNGRVTNRICFRSMVYRPLFLSYVTRFLSFHHATHRTKITPTSVRINEGEHEDGVKGHATKYTVFHR